MTTRLSSQALDGSPSLGTVFGWCSSPFSYAVFPFLPINSFMGFFLFMVCSFTSSHQILSCTLLAS
jgi:hypothetical protein